MKISQIVPEDWADGRFVPSSAPSLRKQETFYFIIKSDLVRDKQAVTLRKMDIDLPLIDMKELLSPEHEEPIGYRILTNVQQIRTPSFMAFGKPTDCIEYDDKDTPYLPLRNLQVFKAPDTLILVSTGITPYWEQIEFLF